MANADDHTTDIGLLNSAWSYFRAAEFLELSTETKQLRLNPDDAIEFLSAHAYELLFKSYLRTKGLSVAQLSDRKKFGHDLTLLLAEARKQSLHINFTAGEEIRFDALANRHGREGLSTRYYSTNGKAQSPPPELREFIFPMFRCLMNTIETEIVPDRVRNAGLRTAREPGPVWPSPMGLTIDEAADQIGQLP